MATTTRRWLLAIAILAILPLKSFADPVIITNFDYATLRSTIDGLSTNGGGTITFSNPSNTSFTNFVVVTNPITITNGTNVIQTNEVVTNPVVSANIQIQFTNEIPLTNPVEITISGSGNTNVTFIGNGFCRLFSIRSNATLNLDNVVLQNGISKLGGAVSNGGTFNVDHVNFFGNKATNVNGVNGGTGSDGTDGRAASGGAIYNVGITTVTNCAFVTNYAIAGKGGNGGNGRNDSFFGGNGGKGGNGALGQGGAIFSTGRLVVDTSQFDHNGADGGDGGAGGAGGSGGFPGTPGDSGAPAGGYGGAIYVGGSITNNSINASLFVNNATFSGSSANQISLKSGVPGAGAGGGAIINLSSLYLTNCTIVSNYCVAGNGGGAPSAYFAYGGTGGFATGGGIYNGGKLLYLMNCTFAYGSVTNGNGGTGAYPDNRHNGSPGQKRGGNLGEISGKLQMANTIVAFAYPSNVFGGITDFGHNITTDKSFPRGKLATTNTLALLSLSTNGGPTLTMALGPGSIAVDGGTLGTSTNVAPLVDQRGTNRDTVPDVGAFELTGPYLITAKGRYGTNTPIEGFFLHVTGNGYDEIFPATNSDNTASFVLTNRGTYTFIPEPATNHFTPSSIDIFINNSTNLIFTNTGYSVTGRVVSPSGLGLAGIAVTVSNSLLQSAITSNTAANGVYIFRDLPPGTVVLTPSGARAIFSPTNRIIVDVSTNRIGVPAFIRYPTHIVTGVVSNAPFGISFTVTNRATTGHPSTNVNVSSYFVGTNYVITNLLGGMYIVTPVSSDFVITPSNRVVAVSNDVSRVNFRAISRIHYEIAGRLTDGSSNPITNAIVQLIDSATSNQVTTATSDTNGYYLLDNQKSGSYLVQPVPINFVFTPANTAVTLNLSSPVFTNDSNIVVYGVTNIDFQGAATNYTVSGTITNANGPLADVTVNLYNSSSPSNIIQTTTTAGDGTYTITSSAGTDFVQPQLSGYIFSPTKSANFALGPNNVTNINFTATRVFNVGGIVLLNDGTNPIGSRAVGNLSVWLQDSTGSNNIAKTFTDQNTNNATFGTFLFSNVVAGSYVVFPTNVNFNFQPSQTNFTVSSSDLSLTFIASNHLYSISGVITNGSGAGLSNITVIATSSTNQNLQLTNVTDITGAYSISNLISGSYDVKPQLTNHIFFPTHMSATLGPNDVTNASFEMVQ